ncbi:hypothetical protein N7448_003288 [Penicillium atrosanguineum]|uniref:Potassium channel domain-containing protein n=1 Tax=Penicillium atrosanguineum TaxID=1132637 RepID=A0A9W9H745_9EURO|nr:uncharacterized protein N7443_002258 [Penicillium atrosanguineum]KAJ5122156.1 hypothetical protein N7526_009093 [Penicillium atrosanguineum]KAJ5139880.1 hypothetical protein N7448_003288 [Penicillium atrosanguineum]KAJ5309797.1 hypothetical protein N7443_002258 [Penicillium atrosanguineum]KAJ5315317.1 hypothetical protein N7476_005624 [Penicillium atrosanguineum]
MQNGYPLHQTPTDDRAARPSAWERFCSLFHMRPPEDDEPQSWWIASTAIPLVAAAAGPLANVMSIVALVMPWRSRIISNNDGPAGNIMQAGYPDPHWITAMNAVSLFCGVVGNVFLLFNFTTTIRYIIALPVTIVLWFLATGILGGLTASLSIYSPPIAPDHIYSQGYWSAVIAASLYFILAFLLMINMLGYFLGRYPQHFSLTDDQRTLILQMTAFVVWLLIGAAIFQKVLGISFADALYFSDITVLTLGFGDVVPTTSVGRGLVWPYAVIGIIQLGLVVGSIHRFAKEVHYDNVVLKHIEQKRQSTYERTITCQELDEAREEAQAQGKEPAFPPVTHRRHHPHQPIRNTIHALANNRRPKLLVMREEKDRFDAMRAIQYETLRFRRWNDLVISIIAFGIVWSCGAVVFWQLENDMDYFESLYFCFCSLITIGYGDFTPKSNAGRPFFIVWSLIAIPTMTMLISQMTDTVVAGVKHSTERFADFFVLPQSESYRTFLARFPCILRMLQRREEKQRVKLGFPIGAQVGDVTAPEDGPSSAQDPEKITPPAPRRRSTEERPTRTIEELARETNPSPFELAEQLAFAIRRTTQDVREGKRKRYKYEEWVEFTRLIQFTDPRSRPSSSGARRHHIGDGSISVETDEFGVLNWDWIGESSPMLARLTEPEWILDRLCESLIRYVSTQEQARATMRGQVDDQSEEPTLKKERDLGIDQT